MVGFSVGVVAFRVLLTGQPKYRDIQGVSKKR